MTRSTGSLVQLPRRRLFSALELHAVAIGSVGAAVLLIGWGFGVDALQRVIPGFPTMKATTAAAFMLLSVSCLTSLRASRRSHVLSVATAFIVLAGLATMLILDPERQRDGTWAQVPSEATVVCLTLCAIAMMLIMLAPRRPLVVGALALIGATLALYRLFAMILFGGAPNNGPSPLDTMAVHTAVLIVWFMSGCVLAHPRLGFGEALFQASLRGRVLRRALPFVIVVPATAGAVGLSLSLVFDWPQEMLFALTATLSVTMGAGLIWWLSSLAAQWQAEANEHSARLSRANEALEQYASSAAHDLKGPVRHALLYGELLEEALARGDIAAAQKHARAIHDSAKDLPGIIEGMLEYSRSGFSALNPGDHALSELVQAATSLLETDLRAAGAHIVILHEAGVLCDATLMTTVFQNLIANSAKNRRRDRPLDIRIDAERKGDLWEISVTDNGVGFDPQFAAVAFNPLARGVHLAGEGTGIGLATCRTIVRSHGGEIRVDPTYKGGARIEFTLPARTGSSNAKPARIKAGAAKAGPVEA